MGENTKIEWADHTFSPWLGCTRMSPACENCYAESWAKRSGLVGWGPKAPRRLTSEANWHKPLKWNAAAKATGKRARVFCASLADVFDGQTTYWDCGDICDFSSTNPFRVEGWFKIDVAPAGFHYTIASKRDTDGSGDQGWDVSIGVGLLGLFWGVLYYRRGSAVMSMANHAGFNAAQVLSFVAASAMGA